MKKKVLYATLALFLPALLCFLQGCKRENDPPEPEIFLFDQAMYDYCYFKTGTWWVYRDSATGMLDTVVIVENGNGIDTAWQEGRIWRISDWFSCHAENKRTGYTNRYFGHSSFKNLVKKNKTTTGNYIGETIHFFSPSDIGAKRYPLSGGTVEIIACFESLQLNNKIFKKVFVLDDSKNLSNWGTTTVTKLAQNTGIIQFEIKDSAQVWQLIDHHIIQ